MNVDLCYIMKHEIKCFSLHLKITEPSSVKIISINYLTRAFLIHIGWWFTHKLNFS